MSGTGVVVFRSPSRANDAGMLATRDITLLAGGRSLEYRLVGGNAVSLLAELYGVAHLVPSRDTADVDFGAGPQVVANPELPSALADLGYQRVEGNRFTRTASLEPLAPGGSTDSFELVIDVLAPSYTGRLETNQTYGDLVVDEVPGLHLALARPGVTAQVEAHLRTGHVVSFEVVLPDLISALCLKSFAYVGRLTDRDAQDLWRLLEAASAAGVRPGDWPLGVSARDAKNILRTYFAGPRSSGLHAASSVQTERTRILGLVARVVGLQEP